MADPPLPCFVCSWDDGHPLDLRLAELLERHGFAAAFYPLPRAAGRRPVMTPAELRTLGAHFELGGHTLDHPDLTRLPPDEVWRQVAEGKERLEEILGREVEGFCYPKGLHSPAVRALVRQAGFRYARTTRPFFATPGPDPWLMPVTVQCRAHPTGVYWRQWLGHGHRPQRWEVFRAMAGADGWLDGAKDALAGVIARGGVFHLWGHSWELEEQQLWSALAAFLAHAGERIPPERRLAPGELPS